MKDKPDKRKLAMQRQRARGMTYQQIADAHAVSRQRVHAILGADSTGNELGNYCREWRSRLRLSQEQACKVLGISFQAWLSNLESATGRYPLPQPGILLRCMQYYEQLAQRTIDKP